MNALSFPSVSRAPEPTFSTNQLINPQINYQQIPLYYNLMVPNMQSSFQQQIIMPQNLNSIPNNSQQQQQGFQQQYFSHILEQNEQKQQQQLKKAQLINNLQQKINLMSQILQISSEEIISLIQDNICMCCRNSLTDKNCLESNQESIAEKEKLFNLSSTQISQQSLKEFHSNQSITHQQQNNKSQLDKQSEINRHQDTLVIQFDKNLNKFRDSITSKSQRTTISNEINNKCFEGLNGFQQESYDEQENDTDCSKEESNSKITLQQNINHMMNSQAEKASSNSTQSFYAQIKVEAKEVSPLQTQASTPQVQDIINPEKKQAQYALLKKGIQKQSKDVITNKKKLYFLNTSEQKVDDLDMQKQQQQSNNLISSTLCTSLQIQKPQSQTSQISLNSNQTIFKINEMNQKYLAQVAFDDDDEQNKQKKEYQNDSNYTKNLLKGFRRVIIKNYGSNLEFISDFKKYFDSFSLNNEFILKLFSDSPYSVYFSEFLQTDPSWWMKEARIKDTDNQLEFFEICKRRQFSLIRTKRKKFIRPKLI
ncbi:hypothetical protein TTHERM_00471650 (macronuclear) [Tetrahymena thermophila SB210]|uniref:Uncharacterized protein n=1 Tax=Tetrahymena thermophila (strain SB210) TaxID=312017 RepID=I7MGQ0_TETTS|nr:hypothetical protein TTHERM_00471650 [Tetrahymena thermophila SB210]EAR85386.1 hypothetical protein TTHERM_00471650 [Tetrahymena thermophila SB210]|eukprot:XP_001033049.1 hypothetical protein TTHERM_00471650 [Tetrahymena thermophila SB210]